MWKRLLILLGCSMITAAAAVIWLREDPDTSSGHAGPVHSVAFSPDGTLLASASSDKTIKLWNAAERSLRSTLNGHTDKVRSIAFLPDGKGLVSGGNDTTIRFWDSATGQEIVGLRCKSKAAITSIAVRSDGNVVACGTWATRDGSDDSVDLWDARTAKLLHSIQHVAFHGSFGFTSVAFSRDGKKLAASADTLGWGFTVNIWEEDWKNSIRMQCSNEIPGIHDVAFSPDGTALAGTIWGTPDGVLFWDVASGNSIRQIARGQEVSSIVFAPDGATIATGNNDGSVTLWNVKTGETENVFRGHGGRIWSVAFNHDGSLLASGSEDGTVRLWKTPIVDCALK